MSGFSPQRACGPTDAMKSILLRQLVALNNAAMDGYRRAAQTDNLQARDVELRHATKATAAVAELISDFRCTPRSRPEVGQCWPSQGGIRWTSDRWERRGTATAESVHGITFIASDPC